MNIRLNIYFEKQKFKMANMLRLFSKYGPCVCVSVHFMAGQSKKSIPDYCAHALANDLFTSTDIGTSSGIRVVSITFLH